MFVNKKIAGISYVLVFSLITISLMFHNLVPYEFYTIKRLLMFCSLGYLSFFFFKFKYQILSSLLAVSSLLFNPFFPLYLKRYMWVGVDIVILTLSVISLFYLFISRFKKDDSEIDTIEKQIEELKKNCNNLEKLSKNDWQDKIKIIGITIGHFNENLVRKLAEKFNTQIHHSLSESINELRPHLNKTSIDDIHYLNRFRNKIIHFKDYNHTDFVDFSNIDSQTKQYYTNESKLVYLKLEHLYEKFLKE